MRVIDRGNRTVPLPRECPLTECLAVRGGAWTPNAICAGPRTFNELRSDIQGISGKVRSARLQRLARDGVVDRRLRDTSPPTVEYEHTDVGRELLPAVPAIVDVGHRLKARRTTPAAPRARASGRARQT